MAWVDGPPKSFAEIRERAEQEREADWRRHFLRLTAVIIAGTIGAHLLSAALLYLVGYI